MFGMRACACVRALKCFMVGVGQRGMLVMQAWWRALCGLWRCILGCVNVPNFDAVFL